MLRPRRAELAEELRSTSERLAAVERRLRLIEGEASMSEREFVDGGFEIGGQPAVADAVTLVHLGSMATIGESWQAIGGWLGANDAEPAGACREVYLESPMDDQDSWVTELQQPFVRRS